MNHHFPAVRESGVTPVEDGGWSAVVIVGRHGLVSVCIVGAGTVSVPGVVSGLIRGGPAVFRLYASEKGLDGQSPVMAL